MEKRHNDELMHRIDEVANLGVSAIKWWEIRLWYNRERIGKTIWRDLKARFDEAAEDSNAELWIYESEESVTLVHSDLLKPITDKMGEED